MPVKKLRLKVIINTSVIISHLYGGASKKVVDLWKHGHLQLIVSAEIVEEYLRVLSEQGLSERAFDGFSTWFSHQFKVTAVRPVTHFRVCRDESDDMFLDAAYAGKAKYIISWDKDLLTIEEFKGIKIVNPGEFLEIYEQRQD
jgi:putative PIN family toxin of toxin-antitoxin system